MGIKGESHRSDTFQIHFVFEENAADRKVAQSCARLFESEIPGFISAYNDKKGKLLNDRSQRNVGIETTLKVVAVMVAFGTCVCEW